MTTKKEKKSVKKAKVVKNGSPAGKTKKRANVAAGRSKVVVKSPVASEIDKEKMAAFFSAGGLKEPVAVEKVKSEPAATVAQPPESPAPVAPVVEKPQPEVKAVKEVPKKITPEVKVPKVNAPKVSGATVVNEDQKPKKQNLKEKEGENKMATTEPVKSSTEDSGSISILPIFVILFCMAAFWFYYISSAPLQKAAATMVEQGQTQILKLEKKVKSLQSVIAGLQADLQKLESSSRPQPVIPAKKAVKGVTIKGSSFDKAPVPFWRNYKHPSAKQLGKLSQNKKSSAVQAPGAKVDSFSKAPVPFWRKTTGTQSAAKVKDGKKPHGSSFDKAPVPFWRK